MDRQTFREGVAEILGADPTSWITQEEESRYYEAGFTLYEAQEYRKASAIFTRLVLANPFYPPYWKALASSKQMSSEYEAAMHAWMILGIIDESCNEAKTQIEICSKFIRGESKAPDMTKLQKALEEAKHVLH